MKNLTFIFLFLTAIIHAQVGVGTATLSSSNVILEFGTDARGIILPRIADLSEITNPTNGMLVYDKLNNCMAFFKNNTWDTCNTSPIPSPKATTGNVAGVVIGGNTNVESAVLNLIGTNKALVLPVANLTETNIASSAKGILVFDKLSDQLKYYNGSTWVVVTEL